MFTKILSPVTGRKGSDRDEDENGHERILDLDQGCLEREETASDDSDSLLQLNLRAH